MKEQYFLSIDNGTQSVRAIVFDGQGQLIAKSKIDIEPYFSNQKGWAEQHADYFWDSLCQACQELWPKLQQSLSSFKRSIFILSKLGRRTLATRGQSL